MFPTYFSAPHLNTQTISQEAQKKKWRTALKPCLAYFLRGETHMGVVARPPPKRRTGYVSGVWPKFYSILNARRLPIFWRFYMLELFIAFFKTNYSSTRAWCVLDPFADNNLALLYMPKCAESNDTDWHRWIQCPHSCTHHSRILCILEPIRLSTLFHKPER